MGGYQLSVDFGTSSTCAVLAGPDGEHHPLLFDGEEFLPSAACLDNAPHLLVGRDALDLGQAHPDRLAAHPKRAVDSGIVVLGGVECPVGDLYAAVFARVAAEARRVAGEPMTAVTLTHPACWDRRRQATLTRAAAKVGLGPTRLVAEPVAAALHVVDDGTLEVPDGASLIVYDLGAGTFDAAVVRRSGPTFTVLAQRGLPDAGGLDLDAAILQHLGELLTDDTIRWERLTLPQTVEDRRAARRLLDEVRAGKELLSRAEATTIMVPLFEEAVPLDRAELERIARPLLDRTVAATIAAVTEAGVAPADVAGVLLVGGSSRIPLVSQLLHAALGVEPTEIRRPKLAFADGCLPVRPRNPARRPRRAGSPTGGGDAADSAAASEPPVVGPETAEWAKLSAPPSSAAARSSPPAGAPTTGSSGSPSTALRTAGPETGGSPASGSPSAGSRAAGPETGGSPAVFEATVFEAAEFTTAGPGTAAPGAPTAHRPAGAGAPPRSRATRAGWAATAAAPGGWATAAAGRAAGATPDRPATAAGRGSSPLSGDWATGPADHPVPPGERKVTRVKAARAAKLAAGTLVGAAVAIVAGVWVGFAVAPSESIATIEVGQCVRQDGAGTRLVDCAEPGAYTVTSRVFPAGACPDPAQPYAMQQQTQLCLAPAAPRRVGPVPRSTP